jgi:hypothetical protein
MTDEEWSTDDQWEGDATEHKPRAVRTSAQTVAFAQDDLDSIRDAAARAGLRPSEYIRLAALEKVRRDASRPHAKSRAG